MKAHALFAIVLVAGAALAACDDADGNETLSPRKGAPPPGDVAAPAPSNGPQGPNPGTNAGVPTNSPAGKEYFRTTVHPTLVATCGSCHDSTGPGPAWLAKADADRSYTLQFQLGYVSKTSRVLLKGPHATSGPALTAEQTQKFHTWIDMELKDGGMKAPPNVLEKLGSCLDQTKFDAIGFENLLTTRREAGNNPNDYEEDPETCTGCNQAQCSTCHSADPASGFMMALGNAVLPAERTFEETKKITPPYLQKYLGVSATGDPVASNALKIKAEATAKDKPYSHPMYTLSEEMETALQEFVTDAIDRYKAGTCGK